MKRISLLIILSLSFLTDIYTQKKVDYANQLNSCLDKKEVNLLNNGIEIFESILLKTYNTRNISASYESFLKSVQTRNIPLQIFKNKQSTEFVKQFKSLNLFNEIWKIESDDESDEEEIIITTPLNKNNSEPEEPFYELNQSGKYLNCLLKNSKSNSITEYLKTIKEISGISPGLLAGSLTKELQKSDYESSFLRLIIAVNFYYELKINLEKI